MNEHGTNGELNENEELLQKYLQGELDLSEMEAFENSAFSVPEQAESVLAYSKLLDHIADSVEEVAPELPDSTRARVLSIAETLPISQVIRASGGEWLESGVPGIQFKLLFQDPDTKKLTVLGRIGAGGRMPAHRHKGIEECLVLEGSLWTDGVLLHAGDYIVTQDDTVHEDTWSPNGAIVLLKTFMADEMLSA